MNVKHDYFYKIATYPHEFEQIHQLNYKTFSEEIPQHQKNEYQKLVDPFHQENTYIICLKENELIGMIAVRDNRPFSLDKKIGPVEQSLPFLVNKLCEIRLLAVKKEHRNGRVFLGLAQFLAKFCLKKGYDAAVISGTVRQLKLYKQMGFIPFSKMTGSNEAPFQPMYLTKQTFEKSVAGRILQPTIPFLPGPVRVSETVLNTMSSSPYSHRSEVFCERLEQARNILCQLTNSKYVEILLGTGTLANDVIAGQLTLEKGRGLILVNGEFGNRLVEQANRFGLTFGVLKKDRGHAFSKEEILSNLNFDTTWIWAVHSETSTGMLNDLEMIKTISLDYDLKLCLDCISSIGAIDLNLDGVFLASGVSGKAVSALTGLSFVFHNHEVKPHKRLPKYLDLGVYFENRSIPFSHSSNLIDTLLAALKEVDTAKFESIRETYSFFYKKFTSRGFKITTSLSLASPIIITLEIPKGISSMDIGESLFLQGFQLHYESAYLREKNWIQIACVGEYQKIELEKMIELLSELYQYHLNYCTMSNQTIN